MSLEVITPRRKKPSLFADLHKDMRVNPITDDLALQRDEEAVKESLKNLVLTNKGERLMKPLVGGNVRSMLFENITPASIKMIEVQIRTTIEEQEPRVRIIDIAVNTRESQNKVRVDIKFFMKNTDQPLSTTVFLERAR